MKRTWQPSKLKEHVSTDLDPEWRQKKGKKFYVIEGKKVEKKLSV